VYYAFGIASSTFINPQNEKAEGYYTFVPQFLQWIADQISIVNLLLSV
jgi:hypothetical protein